MLWRHLFFFVLCSAAAACSFLAPSDEELGGGVRQTTATGGVAGAGVGGAGGSGGDSVCPTGYLDGDRNPDTGCTEVPATGLKFWYASDDTTPTPEGLGQWADRSGANRNAFQNDTESRPSVIPGALNGMPVVRFDGVDDNLGINAGFSDLEEGITFAAVVSRADGVGPGYDYGTLLDLKNTTTDEGRYFSRYGESSRFVYGISLGSLIPSPDGSFPPNVPVLIVAIHEPSRARVRICGAETEQAVPNPGSVVHDSITVGTNRGDPIHNYAGDIAEMLFYRYALDASDLARLESYLISKWPICQ